MAKSDTEGPFPPDGRAHRNVSATAAALNGQINQWKRMGSPEIDPNIYIQDLLYNTGVISYH